MGMDKGMNKSPTPKKKPWINALVAMGSLVISITVLEGVLALAGVRPLSLSEDPYVGFATGQPLFIKKTDVEGRAWYETNPVKLTHFNLQSFPIKKAAGTYRIFTLGGSTTYGHPYRDPTSYSGWLREILTEADSSRKFEVINCGGISYASYREAQLVEELSHYEPDLFVIYSGHNEFLEERTYRKTRELPAWMREASAMMDRTRTYSAMRRALRSFSGGKEKSNKTQMAAEETNILEHTIGPTSYTRDDELKKQVMEHYDLSLRRIARIAHSTGATTLFLSTPSSEKDCSPFKSESTPSISQTQRDSAAQLLKQGVAQLENTDAKGAWAKLNEAANLDPRNAEVLYEAGRAALALQNYPEAKILFRKALDEDICPLRALTPLREITRVAALETKSHYMDFVDIMEKKTQRDQGHNILGEPDFLDHVHLNVEDYGILAHGIFDELVRMNVVHPSASFTQNGMAQVHTKIMARLTPSEEGLGLHNIAKVLNWAGKREDAARIALRGLAKDSASLEAIWSSLFVDASLERHGKSPEAIPHYRRALRLDSNNAETRRILGEALTRTGDTLGAEYQLSATLQLDPDNMEVRGWLAHLEFNHKQYAEAARDFRVLVTAFPQNMNAAGMLAASLVEAGQFDEAETRFQSLVQKNPGDANAWFGLGYIAEKRGRLQDAIQDYARASQLDPNFVGAQKGLGRLLGGIK